MLSHFSGMMAGPSSMGRPKPSKTRPSMSCDTPSSMPLPRNLTLIVFGRDAAGAFEHLDQRLVAVHFEHAAAAHLAVGQLDVA